MDRDFDSYIIKFNNLPFERELEKIRHRRVLKLIKNLEIKGGSKALEIGPGYMPIYPDLSGFELIDVLEPIEELYSSNLKQNFTNVNHFNLTLEEFTVKNNLIETYDLIILSSVLHEFAEPEVNLRICNKLLNKSGIIIVVVPNNNSIHRLIYEKKNYNYLGGDLSKTEILMQQSTSFSVESLENLLLNNNFIINSSETGFTKLFPNEKIQELMNIGLILDLHLDFLDDISKVLPGLGAEIFISARKEEL